MSLDLAGEFLDYFAACSLLPPVVLLLVIDYILILPLSILKSDQVVRKETILVVILAQSGTCPGRGLQGNMILILVTREDVVQVTGDCDA